MAMRTRGQRSQRSTSIRFRLFSSSSAPAAASSVPLTADARSWAPTRPLRPTTSRIAGQNRRMVQLSTRSRLSSRNARPTAVSTRPGSSGPSAMRERRPRSSSSWPGSESVNGHLLRWSFAAQSGVHRAMSPVLFGEWRIRTGERRRRSACTRSSHSSADSGVADAADAAVWLTGRTDSCAPGSWRAADGHHVIAKAAPTLSLDTSGEIATRRGSRTYRSRILPVRRPSSVRTDQRSGYAGQAREQHQSRRFLPRPRTCRTAAAEGRSPPRTRALRRPRSDRSSAAAHAGREPRPARPCARRRTRSGRPARCRRAGP